MSLLVPLELLQPDEFYRSWTQSQSSTRPNGRSLLQSREATVEFGVISHAAGSAMTRIGNTSVLTVMKAEVVESADDLLVLNVHFTAGSRPEVRWGPPSEKAQRLSHHVNETLAKVNIFGDSNRLEAIPDRFLWCLFVDIFVLQDDGSLEDAIWLSLATTFSSAMLPKVRIDEEIGAVVFENPNDSKLPISCLPIAFSSIELGNRMLVDPDFDEEKHLGAKNILVFDALSGDLISSSMHSFASQQVTEFGLERVRQLKKLLKSFN